MSGLVASDACLATRALSFIFGQQTYTLNYPPLMWVPDKLQYPPTSSPVIPWNLAAATN